MINWLKFTKIHILSFLWGPKGPIKQYKEVHIYSAEQQCPTYDKCITRSHHCDKIWFKKKMSTRMVWNVWNRLDCLRTIWPIIIAADGNRCRWRWRWSWRWSGRWCWLSPWCGFFRITGRCVIKVTNPASLYTLHCVRHMTCSHTLAVRFARYAYCTCSVCALHVR